MLSRCHQSPAGLQIGVMSLRDSAVQGVFETFASFEFSGLACRDLNGSPCLRVATLPGRAIGNLKGAKTWDRYLLSLTEGVLDTVEQGTDRLAGVRLG